IDNEVNTENIEEDYPLTPEQVLAEYMEASGSDDEWTEDTKSVYPRLITTERIREGSRLSWIAKRYYGSKTYWPYLYDANKDHISNPNDIDVGTPIRIPKLSKAQMDTTDALTRANLERLRQEAERAMR
ncbi:MAG: LysM peptidoglycan-binding domain-containing protein, partial [Paludibacteraceae bacterium]|nr:LysM peptidoglycan-binding domain-containing protein [Paludibacteraceae bacterium]